MIRKRNCSGGAADATSVAGEDLHWDIKVKKKNAFFSEEYHSEVCFFLDIRLDLLFLGPCFVFNH